MIYDNGCVLILKFNYEMEIPTEHSPIVLGVCQKIYIANRAFLITKNTCPNCHIIQKDSQH